MVDLNKELQTKIPLRFHEDGTFKILLMSDLHLSAKKDERTLRAMNIVLDAEKPDLVLLGGDVITDTPVESDVERLVAEIARPMERRQIPWAHVYGNHDEPTSIPKVLQQPYFEQFPHCVSKWGNRELPGVGNYVLPILASQGERTAFAVWGLDSHHTFRDVHNLPYDGDLTYDLLMPSRICGRSDEDFIRFEQILWYWNVSKALEECNGAKVPGLMYFHIPLYEFNAILQNSLRTGMTGEYNEAMCTSEVNSGLFAALLQRGDVKGVYCGHDHINTFDGLYCGIRLGYDGGIGYKPYGTRANDPDPDRDRLRGARVFELNEKDAAHYATRMVYVRDLLKERAHG